MTRQEVHQAFAKSGPLKGPGQDEIIVKAVKETIEELGERIRETYDTALNNGNHTKEWRQAVGAIIPKPKKQNYLNLKNYRQVSPQNVLSKGLDRTVGKRITQLAEENREKKLHRTQWSGRKGRSAEKYVEATLEWARGREQEGKKVMLIVTNIAQAFPNVVNERLVNRVRDTGIEEQLARWKMSFMSACTVKLKFDKEEGEWHPVEIGIPQGSTISPRLINIYIAPLLRELERKSQAEWEGDSTTLMFIDDVTLPVAGETWKEAMERSGKMIGWVEVWGTENNVMFEEEKMKCISLRKKEKEGRERLRVEKGEGKEEVG